MTMQRKKDLQEYIEELRKQIENSLILLKEAERELDKHDFKIINLQKTTEKDSV